MLKLPEKLARRFKSLCNTDPSAATRALTNMSGQAGVTWIATASDRIVMFERQLGGDFDTHSYRLADASAFDLDDDGRFACLRITFPHRELTLKFPAIEVGTLIKIQERWTPVTGRTNARAPLEISVLQLFLAALQALIQADENLASDEVGWIQDHMIDTNELRRAGAWLRDNDLEQLLALINDRFDDAQKRCLYGNLISLAMADSAYRRAEAELIGRFRDEIGISDQVHEDLYEMQLALHNTAVFGPLDEGGAQSPEAVNLFCVCLLMMAEYDGVHHRKVERIVERLFRQREIINAARTYLEQLGLEGILEYLPGPLTDAQKRCIILNQLRIAVSDGVFNRREQELLDRFQCALQLDVDRYQQDVESFLTQQNLSVFASDKTDEPT